MKANIKRYLNVLITLTALAIITVLFSGCNAKRGIELESFREPEVKISELPKETTTEPPTQPPTTAQQETTTEEPTEPETQPPVKLRVIFDDNGADASTFKVQSFEEGVTGQSFSGDIEKNGSEFKGWSLSVDGSGPLYPKNSSVSDSWLLDMNRQYGESVMLYASWESPEYEPLSPGDINEDVVLMQSALYQLGYYSSAIDGSYGPGTQKAVSAFRYENGLPADGTADAEMLALLFQLAPQEISDQK